MTMANTKECSAPYIRKSHKKTVQPTVKPCSQYVHDYAQERQGWENDMHYTREQNSVKNKWHANKWMEAIYTYIQYSNA